MHSPLARLLAGAGALALLGLPGFSQGATDTFEGGLNQGGWSYGNPGDTIQMTGGNPGAHLRNPTLDTFAPQLRTTAANSGFLGNWRTKGITSFSFDLRTWSTQFGFQREATLMLSSGSCTVYRVGTEFVPQVAEGWKSFQIAVDAQSPTLPSGWTATGGCGSPDAEWNTVITGVTEVRIFYGEPTFFYIFDMWDVSTDNLSARTDVGTRYCTAAANSTGAGATIVATGSTSVAENALRLSAAPVPANQSGIFFYGPNQANVPFGNGFRCVGGGSVGLQRLPIVNAGPSGELVHQLDLGNPPTGAGTILPGSTWNFQAWYRDPLAGGATFNLSDAISIGFTN